jgi:hypothetical protein
MNLPISIYDILYCNIANTKTVRHPVQMDKHKRNPVWGMKMMMI